MQRGLFLRTDRLRFRPWAVSLLGLIAAWGLTWQEVEAAPIPVSKVQRTDPVSFEKEILPILRKSCLACHSASEKQGEIVLETAAGILKGGDSGPAVLPGRGADSLLIKLASHQTDPVMPPPENDVAAKNLTSQELGLLKLWIDQGARGGSGGIDALSPQKWQPLPPGVQPVQALALTEDGQYVAAGRANQIFLYHVPTGRLVTRLSDPALDRFSPGAGSEASDVITGIAHRDLVQSLAFNLDGDLLASGSFREVKIWRRPRDVERQTLPLGGAGTALAVSPDRAWIAIAIEDNTVRLFRSQDGQPGPVLQGHAKTVTSLKFSPQGTELLSASLDQTVRLWNVSDGSLIRQIGTPAPIHALELVDIEKPANDQTAPRQQIITGHEDKLLRVWNPLAAPSVVPSPVPNTANMAASSDGQLLAVVDQKGTLRILLTTEKEQKNTRQEISAWKVEKGISALVFVPRGGKTKPVPENADPQERFFLATGASDGTIRLWNVAKGTLLREWRSDGKAVRALASSADGTLLTSGQEDGALVQWKIDFSEPAEEEREVAPESKAPVAVAVVSPSRKLLAYAGVQKGQPAVFVRNLETRQLVATFRGPTAAIRSLAFTGNETALVGGGDDKTLYLWNVQNPGDPQKAVLKDLPSAITAVAANGDGSQLLAGFADQTVRLYNPQGASPEEQLIKEFSGHGGPILHAGFFNNQVFSVSADKSLRFWNVSDGKAARVVNLPAGVRSFAVSSDGQRMALAGDDKQVRIIQTNNGAIQQTLSGFAQHGVSLSFSSDAQRLSVLTSDGELSLWQLKDSRLLESVRHPKWTMAYWTADSATLVVGESTGHVSLWPTAFLRRFEGNTKPVTDLVYHPNGQILFMTAADGSFRGYNTQNGQQTFSTSHGAAVHDLAISPNGNILATAGENAQVRFWNPSGGGVNPQQIAGLPGPVTRVTFSPEGKSIIVAVSAENPVVDQYDLSTGKLRERYYAHAGPAWGCLTHPLGEEGKTAPALRTEIVTAAGIETWIPAHVRELAGHGGAVRCLASLPGTPGQVLSGSQDRTIRHWDLANGRQIRQFNHGGTVLSIALSPDGQRLASVSDNRIAKLFRINGQEIAQLRGDLRRIIAQTRTQQRLRAATAQINVAKQQLQQAEQDLPKRAATEKKLSEDLAKANKEVTDKQTALNKALADKIAAEQAAIQASANAKNAVSEKTAAERAAQEAAMAMQLAQAKMQRLQQAASSDPENKELKQALEEAKQNYTACQKMSQAAAAAVPAPTQKAQQMAALANTAAQKVDTVQKPYRDALTALKTAQANQNLLAQQHVLALKELQEAQKLVPQRKQVVAQADQVLAAVQKEMEAVNKAAQAAEQPIRSVAFSPDGRILLTGGDHPNVHAWEAETGRALAVYAGHSAPIHGVRFLDGETAVSISADKTARVWELNPGWKLERVIGSVDDPGTIVHRVTAVDWNADSSQLLVAGGVPSRSGELHIFQVADGKRVFYLPQAHSDVIYDARFSPDGRRIASGGADKYLRTFEIATSQQLHRFEGHTGYVLGVSWKRDGQVIATSSADDTVKIWNAETADQRRTIRNTFTKDVTDVQFIGETDRIVTSCGDKLIRIFNSANGGLERNFSSVPVWPHCVACAPDRSIVVAGDAQGNLTIWNGQNGQLLRQITAPDGEDKEE